MSLIGTKEAAERLGVSQQRVQALIKNGQLPAEKVGRDWLIKTDDLQQVSERKPGRPLKRQKKLIIGFNPLNGDTFAKDAKDTLELAEDLNIGEMNVFLDDSGSQSLEIIFKTPVLSTTVSSVIHCLRVNGIQPEKIIETTD